MWNLRNLDTLLRFQFVYGFFETFLVDGKFKRLSNKPLHARFCHFLHKLRHLLFSFQMKACCQPHLPKIAKFAKIYPKTISLRNSKYCQKLRFYFAHRGGSKACAHHLDFQYNNLLYAFFIATKKLPLYVNFSIPPCEKLIFFSMFHISCGYEILYTCI